MYGKYFSQLKNTDKQLWSSYVSHEFVSKLAEGTLPRKTFVHYLIQDYIFLIHFSRAWALGIVKAQTLEEMKFCSYVVNSLLQEEIQLHIEFCKKEGIKERELLQVKEKKENYAYTRFAIETGLSGDFLDLIIVLSPCVLGYGEIGQQLNKTTIKNNPYIDWITMYSGKEYQSLCRKFGKLLDGSITTRMGDYAEDNPRWTILTTKFQQAIALEVDFWQMNFAL